MFVTSTVYAEADQTFLRELFIQRLPASVRKVLACLDTTMSIAARADMAEKGMEVFHWFESPAAEGASVKTDRVSRYTHLQCSNVALQRAAAFTDEAVPFPVPEFPAPPLLLRESTFKRQDLTASLSAGITTRTGNLFTALCMLKLTRPFSVNSLYNGYQLVLGRSWPAWTLLWVLQPVQTWLRKVWKSSTDLKVQQLKEQVSKLTELVATLTYSVAMSPSKEPQLSQTRPFLSPFQSFQPHLYYSERAHSRDRI